jgi:hypothetical protein
MAKGGLHGWKRLPGGGVLAKFHETDPSVDCGSLELFVFGPTRQAALARAKSLGVHGVSFKSNPNPPTEEEVRAFFEHGRDMLWRRWGDSKGSWLTIQTWPLGKSE